MEKNLPEPVYTNEIDLKKLLPKVMKNFFWEGILNSFSKELTNLRREGLELGKYFDLSYQKLKALDTRDLSIFVDIAKMYGYEIDLSLEPDPTVVSQLVHAIVQIAKIKTTYQGYEILFKLTRFKGTVFILYWNGKRLLRATDEIDPQLVALNIGNGEDFLNFLTSGKKNYDQFIEGDKLLDITPVPLKLDDTIPWFLDQTFSRLTTKHLALQLIAGTSFEPHEDFYRPNFYFSHKKALMDGDEHSFRVIADYYRVYSGTATTLPIYGADTQYFLSTTYEVQTGTGESDTFDFRTGFRFKNLSGQVVASDAVETTLYNKQYLISTWVKFNGLPPAGTNTCIVGSNNALVNNTGLQENGFYIDNNRLVARITRNNKYEFIVETDLTKLVGQWAHLLIVNPTTNSDTNDCSVYYNGVLIPKPTTFASEEWNSISDFYFNEKGKDFGALTGRKLDVSYADSYIFIGGEFFTDYAIDHTDLHTTILPHVEKFYKARYPLVKNRHYLLSSDNSVTPYKFYNMTPRVMDYFANGIEYNRKLTEVPHVGFQLPLFLSRFSMTDPNQRSEAFTELTANYNNTMSLVNTLDKVLIGNGTGYTALDLNSRVNSTAIATEETFTSSDENWFYIPSTIRANTVKETLSHTGDGVETEFTGKLSYAPIIPKSLRFRYEIEGQAGLVREVTDQYENPIGFYTNYDSLTLTPNKVIAKDAVLTFDYTCPEANVVPNSFVLRFSIEGVLYVISDTVIETDVEGAFFSTYIESSKIDYVNRTVTVRFTQQTDYLEEVKLEYQFKKFDTFVLDKRAYVDINYETGDYTMYTKYVRVQNEIISTTSLTQIVDYPLSGLLQGPITPGKVKLKYYTSDGVQYTVVDTKDPSNPDYGYFPGGNNINNNGGAGGGNSARVRYSTGTLNVQFFNPTSFVNNIEVEYEYTLLSPAANGTKIEAEYETEQNLEITQAALTNKQGQIIAYSEFPPIVLGNSKRHLQLDWIIYRGTEPLGTPPPVV